MKINGDSQEKETGSLLQGVVSNKQLGVAKEFERVVTDENVFGLLWNLEEINPEYG